MADTDAPSDDLRSILSGAIESSATAGEAVAAPVAKEEPKVEAKAEHSESVEAKDDDRARGPDGKFLKKDEAEPKADAKPKEEPKAEVKAEEKTDDKAAADPKADPKEKAIARWSASDKAMFKLQSPEAQDFLLRRNAAMESEFTKRNQEIVELRKDYEPVQKLFHPHLDALKQKGLTPLTVIQRWADVETKLVNGHGVDIIDGIIKGYGIDKGQLAQRLGFTSSPQAGPSTDPAKTQDPAAAGTDPTAQMLAALEQRLAATFEPKFKKIEQWETTQQTHAAHVAQQREAEVETKITNFKTATDKEGNQLHPYYDEVESDMIALAQSYVASKQPLPELEQLYEKAVWANPSTRQALLATQRVAQEAKAAEEARAKAASARRAASSVTGAPGSGQSSRPVRSELNLREIIEDAAAEL